MVIDKLLILHPHLATVPDDAPDGLDSGLPPAPPINWTTAGNIVPIDGEKEIVEGEEQGETVVTDHQDTWEDWALFVGAEIMGDLRAEVYKRLHYTCSAGIAHNKAIAKVSSNPSHLILLNSLYLALLSLEEAECPNSAPSCCCSGVPAGYGIYRRECIRIFQYCPGIDLYSDPHARRQIRHINSE